MRRNSFTCLVGLLAAMAAGSPTARAAKQNSVPATMTFQNRTLAGDGIQDRVTDDGLGAYTNGVDGVSCVVFVGGTGDGHCDLSRSSKPLRVFNVDPSQYIVGTGSGSGPTTLFSSNGTINISALASMPNGTTKQTMAVFATQLGEFQLVQPLNPSTSSVSATRLDDHTWLVTTSDPYGVGSGDIAQLLQPGKGGKSVQAGLYHLPFQVIVTCPTCVAPLQ